MITYDSIVEAAKELYIRSQKFLPEDILHALRNAYEKENNQIAKEILEIILNNAVIAREKETVLCQDTCIPSYYVKIGSMSKFKGNLKEAIKLGAQRAVQEFPIIPHCVHPITRTDDGTNTGHNVPIIHFDIIPDSQDIEITATPIGAGSENPCVLKMFSSRDPLVNIKEYILDSVINAGGRPCPPVVIGIGLGSAFETVGELAKTAAMRPLSKRNSDPIIAELEEELLEVINQTNIGPMGLGGRTTALAVNIEAGYCHRPCLPVAIKFSCWATRRACAQINENGVIKYI